MITQAIAKLLADSTLTTSVGRNKADTTFKIFPVECFQEETPPYLTIYLTAAQPIQCKGVGGQPDDETFDVIVWSEDYKELDTIGRRIIDVLNNASGFSRLNFVTHRDGFDKQSKYLLRIITFSGSN